MFSSGCSVWMRTEKRAIRMPRAAAAAHGAATQMRARAVTAQNLRVERRERQELAGVGHDRQACDKARRDRECPSAPADAEAARDHDRRDRRDGGKRVAPLL